MQLDDKVAVITGGTRGIGLGVAKAFLDEGAKVLITSRSEEKGAAALAELGRGQSAVFVSSDVSDRGSIDAVIEAAVERFGQLDILVNNAGGAEEFAPVAQMADEVWDRVMVMNLSSAFWASRKALQHMVPRGTGRIINMSSVEGKHGKPGLVHYVAAKHGLNGLTKGLSKEVGGLGITVNALCPGLVITDLVEQSVGLAASATGLSAEQLLSQYSAEAAIGRPNTVEEVAALAVLVASDAGSGITGALLSVDGGTAAY